MKILLSLLLLSVSLCAQTLPRSPLPGVAESIGSYSSGCLIGAEAMNIDMEGIHQMRISRGKFWGHPELIGYLSETALKVKKELGRDLLVSDLGLARGGPNLTGHVSHQNGLDADVWFKTIPTQAPLSLSERELMGAYSVVKNIIELETSLWVQLNRDVSRILASDERIQRIFVHPVVKKDLCENSGFSDELLSKFRPWYGHDDHYHVRIRCPIGSPDCRPQAEVPDGNGCDELDWWFEELQRDDEGSSTDTRTPEERYRDRLDALPQICKEVLEL